jgi:Protein of unknown function (DUF1572)
MHNLHISKPTIILHPTECTMLINILQTLFNRDLNKLEKEVEQYQNEKQLWVIDKGIANSAGNLCLHLIGNLNTYIGKELGGTGYIRNRDLEFSAKNTPQTELLQKIRATKEMVENTLAKLTAADLAKEYPVMVFDKPMTTEYFLVHLATHLAYHLGQINYHRRLLDGLSV